MDHKLLQEIGLTEGETKVYLTLLRLGEAKTGLIAKESGVSSSKVYKVLDRLIKKGLAGHIIKGKTKHFSAVEPKRILEYMEKKQEELNQKKLIVEKIIPQLELEKKLAIKPDAAIYEGYKAVTNFFRNIIDELKPGEEYYVMGASYIPGTRSFYHQHHIKRAKKKIKLNMLANYNTKENLEKTTFKNADVRFLPQYLSTNMDIVFYKNKAFIFFTTKNPVGFLIINEEAVKGFKSYFDVMWKVAKK
jgi:HTH-type transcriptional regulator, sugar sensing transcriptional regulator